MKQGWKKPHEKGVVSTAISRRRARTPHSRTPRDQFFLALVVLESATTIYGEGSFGALCLLTRANPRYD
jgi:hypothetical protein